MKKSVFVRLLSATIFSFIVKLASSQVNEAVAPSQVINDAGLRANVYIEKKITSKWSLHLKNQGRVNQNITRFYYAYADIGITYKFNKHIKVMFAYVLREKRLKTDFWSTRHRAYVAIVLKQKIGSFEISDRIMTQVQYSNIYSCKDGMLPDYRLRNKITIKYNHNSRFTYYIASEANYKLNSYYKTHLPQGKQFDRMRYFAGTIYELNKRSKIELYYLYENNFNINKPTNNFVTGIGYAHSF